MTNRVLRSCPVCGGELAVSRLHCSSCDTTIEGHFTSAATPFGTLTPDQTQFLMAFIRCEGRFTRLEQELNLSYPTLRNRLGDILRALGFEPERDEPPAAPRLTIDDRRRILEDLEAGRIPYAEAQRRLRGKEGETTPSENIKEA
jgi:hypothetical protein